LFNLDLSSFDTSNVTDMSYMFYGCNSLTNLDLSSFNTSNVTYMGYMFRGCNSLTNLDLSSFDTSNVTYMKDMMKDMFDGCSSLQTLITPEINCLDGISLPCTMYDIAGNRYTSLPKLTKSIRLVKNPSTNVKSFKDVADPSAWYFDSVYWAVENGVTSGMGEGTFQPMAKLSRAQAVTFLYNLAGRPDVSGLEAKEFTDVSNTAWYYNAVKWAVANKITSGYGTGTFQPNATCNRAMIVTFLANYAKAAGTYKEPTTSASFKDVKAKDWFKKSVDWAVENGITSGYGQGTFSPNVTCNRAMMVTFLKKVAELPKV
jgi:surface protein